MGAFSPPTKLSTMHTPTGHGFKILPVAQNYFVIWESKNSPDPNDPHRGLSYSIVAQDPNVIVQSETVLRDANDPGQVRYLPRRSTIRTIPVWALCGQTAAAPTAFQTSCRRAPVRSIFGTSSRLEIRPKST